MDTIINGGRRLEHDWLTIDLTGYPESVPGKVNNAIRLNGNQQYIDLGERTDECMGNFDHCKFGISIFFWLKINEYDDKMFIMSTGTNGIKLYYNQGFVYVTLDNDRKSWRISVPRLQKNVWHYIEFSWHKDIGLSFYVDGELRDQVGYRDIPGTFYTGSSHFYIGRPNEGDVQGRRYNFGYLEIDELEIWYARRDMLLAFQYIIRGKCNL